jgi:hypothetical protein
MFRRGNMQRKGSATRFEFAPMRRLKPKIEAKLVAVEADGVLHAGHVFDGVA